MVIWIDDARKGVDRRWSNDDDDEGDDRLRDTDRRNTFPAPRVDDVSVQHSMPRED
jgi:hypothetical protein